MDKRIKNLIIKFSVIIGLIIYGIVIYYKGGRVIELAYAGLIIAITTLFWILIDKLIWRIPFLKEFIYAAPNIDSIWYGSISREGDAEAHDATLHVKQSWLTLNIRTYTDRADSTAIVAKIISETGNDNFYKLIFLWRAKAKNTEKFDGKGEILGTTILDLDEEKEKMSGYYYTGYVSRYKAEAICCFPKRNGPNEDED